MGVMGHHARGHSKGHSEEKKVKGNGKSVRSEIIRALQGLDSTNIVRPIFFLISLIILLLCTRVVMVLSPRQSTHLPLYFPSLTCSLFTVP